jgi:hypothetical protein
MLFSTVIALIYISTNSVEVLLFPQQQMLFELLLITILTWVG